ncbi:MAG TPA: hypothetical protein VGF17_10140 [Phytomonospora sp.]
MNIGEASDVATVLQAVTTGRTIGGAPIEADKLEGALQRLNARAAKPLQVSIVTDPSALALAARSLVEEVATP